MRRGANLKEKQVLQDKLLVIKEIPNLQNPLRAGKQQMEEIAGQGVAGNRFNSLLGFTLNTAGHQFLSLPLYEQKRKGFGSNEWRYR